MMRIAILGATSQIARDLIVSFSAEKDKQLHLFARRPEEVATWLKTINLPERYLVNDFTVFGEQEFDAVINFVGVGNPAQAVVMGNSIFDVTLHFDDLVLNYLQSHPTCRYLFLSSGAVYGTSFNEPANRDTPAVVAINNLAPQEWYGVSKLYAECRHRAHPEFSIFDIRVFNYFSCTQDISARFLITDILRAIRDKAVLQTSAENIVRDFLHPTDFYKLVSVLLVAPEINAAVDCYSLAPIDKFTLLAAMQKKFDLKFEITAPVSSINTKVNYYSMNMISADFGYKPSFTSLESVLIEAEAMLKMPRYN